MISTAYEIVSELNNKYFFSVLDMKDGYFQINIDDQSSNYCTFGTPFGFFQFCRLPFGICSTPEIVNVKFLNCLEILKVFKYILMI